MDYYQDTLNELASLADPSGTFLCIKDALDDKE